MEAKRRERDDVYGEENRGKVKRTEKERERQSETENKRDKAREERAGRSGSVREMKRRRK